MKSPPVEAIRVGFDVAVRSLDFGSGFLDDEEVTALRTLAEWLGVNPKVATPDNFKKKYGCTCGSYTPHTVDCPFYGVAS